MDDFQVDVLVVGAGNAAACAALAARETGASVAMLEAAPEEERGGNSTYTAGAMRVVFHGVDDLVQLYDLTEDEKRDVDFGRYTADEFLDDMGRVTNYRCDPELTDILIGRSFETLKWMRTKGVRFQPSYGRQAFKVNGKYKFWGGLAVEAWGGGPGLVDLEHKAAVKAGIPIHYRDGRGVADRGGRRRARRHRPPQGPQGPDRRQGRGAGLRRLREQRRDAHALPRADLGSRQGARHALQHRRRHQHGAGDRRQGARQLVGRPRRRLGHERAGVRRPRGRRQLPEALLPARHHGQRQRRALRRRGCRLPQLHLRQVRRGDPEPAAAVRVADLRFQGARPAARRVPHQAHDQGARRHDRGAGQEAGRRRRAAVPEDHQGMERRGDDRGAVQSRRQGRPLHARARRAEEQLGQHDRRAAVRGLCRDLRPHLHLRRAQDHQRGRGREHRRPRRSPACSPPASWWAGCSITTIPAAPAWCRAPCWASWRATARGGTFRARIRVTRGRSPRPSATEGPSLRSG